MDVGVGNVDADDFEHDALAKGAFVMFGELFDGVHDGRVGFVVEVVEFVNFDFGDDKGVAWGFGGDIEESEGLVVFVDFV